MEGEREWENAPCALANRQAGQLMVTHQRVACSWNTRPNMVVPEDRASSPPSPNIETAFTLSSLCFYRGKLQFEV